LTTSTKKKQEECLFCEIVSGMTKSWIVYRDRSTMAILNPFPYTKGHTLIIPIRRYESMFDIPEPLLSRVSRLAKRLCVSYEKSLLIEGVCLEVLNHRLKSSRQRHFHLHVIPRYDPKDKRDPANVEPRRTFPRENDQSLDETLSKIKSEKF
jgi:histidine triad (HIT) family protein